MIIGGIKSTIMSFIFSNLFALSGEFGLILNFVLCDFFNLDHEAV